MGAASISEVGEIFSFPSLSLFFGTNSCIVNRAERRNLVQIHARKKKKRSAKAHIQWEKLVGESMSVDVSCRV